MGFGGSVKQEGVSTIAPRLAAAVWFSRWMARGWSVLVAVTAAIIALTPDPYATAPVRLGEWVSLGLLGFSVLALLTAWRWEALGGVAAIAGVLGSYVAFAVARDLPISYSTIFNGGPGPLPMILLGLPGAIFIIAHLLNPLRAGAFGSAPAEHLVFAARAWSVLSVLVLLILYLNLPLELAARGVKLGLAGWLATLMFPLTMAGGLIVAWLRKGLGSIIALAGLPLLHLTSWLVQRELPAWPFPLDLLIAIPAVMFLYSSARERQESNRSRRSSVLSENS